MSEHDNELRPTRKAPERINRLTMRQQFELLDYVKTHYAASKLADGLFAVQASGALGFPLTVGNIHGAREAFDLPSNRDVAREERKRPQNRLEAIEVTLLALTTRVQALEQWCKELDSV